RLPARLATVEGMLRACSTDRMGLAVRAGVLALCALQSVACSGGSGGGGVGGAGGGGGTGTGNLSTQTFEYGDRRIEGVAIGGDWAFVATESAIEVYRRNAGSWALDGQIVLDDDTATFDGPIATGGVTRGAITRTPGHFRTPSERMHLRLYGLAGDVGTEQLVAELPIDEVVPPTLDVQGDLAAVGDPES